MKKHRAEVKNVILTVYDQEAHVRSEKKERWNTGKERKKRKELHNL